MIAEFDRLTDSNPQKIDRIIRLKQYQEDFIFSTKRYPAMISGWGTGKTMCGIERVRFDCERYPKNQMLVVRKEFTDLQDSTIRDWESYTEIKIDSGREAKFPNGSIVMFRHGEEFSGDNLSNMNLGGVLIEQAEEFESDEPFWKLDGRIRRVGVPHWIAVIGNTRGHGWIYKLWKAKQDEDFELFEATSFDNEDNLPVDTVASWRKLKDRKPKVFNHFVMNSWDEEDIADNCISPVWIQEAKDRRLFLTGPLRRIIGVDVARKGNDKTVFYALEEGFVIGKQELEKKDTMETVGYLLLFAEKHKNIKNFAVDELNAGAGVVDRLNELRKANSKSVRQVISVNSAMSSSRKDKYRNIRAEVWGYGADCFEQGRVQLPVDDTDLCEQLSWVNWKSIDSNKVLQVELKEDIIKRYGRSPDNADAYLYGLWGMQKVVPEVMMQENSNKYGWVNGCYIPPPPQFTMNNDFTELIKS